MAQLESKDIHHDTSHNGIETWQDNWRRVSHITQSGVTQTHGEVLETMK